MTRYFTSGTPLLELEVMMMTVPNFTKRNYRDVCNCRYCSFYSKNKGCKSSHCPYIKERLEVGSINFKGLLSETFGKKIHIGSRMKQRIDILSKNKKCDMFKNNDHKSRFNSTFKHIEVIYCTPNNSYIGALYLLTANKKLWNLVKNEVYAKKIYFENIRLADLDTECYTYYQMARMLYDNIPRITASEISDNELIENHVFKTF